MPQINTLLVDSGPGETRVAALSGERVIEVYHHRQGFTSAGALYRGRACKPLPNANAIFVDIGLERPALMACGANRPPEGSTVDVRVVQPPRSDKGAKVALADAAMVTAALEGHAGSAEPPVCLQAAEHPVAFCARVYGSGLKKVIVTPGDADNLIAEMVDNVRIQTDRRDLFHDYGVDDVVEQALDPVAPFAGGGKLIIEPTAALVAVDVDAGPMPAPAANTAAINALARELRVRGLSGPIIVDLIPTKGRNALVDEFKQAVADDPVRTQVSGLTPEGRLEINRRRSRPSLADIMLDESRSRQSSTDAIALEALRQCVRTGLSSGSAKVLLRAHDAVIAVLRGPMQGALKEAEATLKSPVTLQVTDGARISYIDIVTS
ncbi:MAG: ribonuclease E/G [Rhodospirillaceae bacterium]|nr:ribonuclease E/G [Rhodospirillaceae bacterium]